MKPAIVTHTISCFTDREVLDEHRIFEAPMQLMDDDRQYIDDGPITVDETYHAAHISLSRGELRGSPPPSGTYQSILEGAADGCDAVYGFLPGEKFMNSSLVRVGRELLDDEERIRFWHHDTMPPAAPLLAVLTARLARDAGTDSPEALEFQIDSLVERTHGVLVVPNFTDIIGKFTRVEHLRDRPFEVYPVVTGGEDGAIIPVTAVCTVEQAHDVIVEYVARTSAVAGTTDGAPEAYTVMDILAEPAVEGLRHALQEAFPDAEELPRVKSGRAFGTIAGRGAFGVAFSLPRWRGSDSTEPPVIAEHG